MSGVATAIVSTASLVGNKLASDASNKASRKASQAQTKAAKKAADVQWKMYDQSRKDNAPYRELGREGLNRLTTDFNNPYYSQNPMENYSAYYRGGPEYNSITGNLNPGDEGSRNMLIPSMPAFTPTPVLPIAAPQFHQEGGLGINNNAGAVAKPKAEGELTDWEKTVLALRGRQNAIDNYEVPI